MKKAVFIAIVGIALLLRLPGILQGNFAFTYDSGRDLLAVRDLVYNHEFSLIGQTTGLAGLFYGPWWRWFLVPPFVVFGGSPMMMAAWIACLGVLAAGVAFLWGERRYGLVFGTTFGLTLAASPDIVKITNQLWNPDVLVLFTLITVMLISNIRRASPRQSVLLGFFLAILAEIEMVYGVIFFFGFLISAVLWLRKDISIRKTMFIALGLIVAELPRILFELRHNFLELRTLFTTFGSEAMVFHAKRSWLIYGSLSSVLPGEPKVQNILVIFFFGLIFLLWKRFSFEAKKLILALLTIIGVFLIAIAFFSKDFWNYFLFGLPVLYGVLIAFVFASLWKITPRGTLAILLVYFFFLLKPIDTVKGLIEPHFIGDAALFQNQMAVVNFVYAQAKGNFKYIVYTPPQYDYSWQYLFWWQDRKKHRVSDKDVSEMFVIIEPDPGYPDRVRQWLKIRERDGVLLREISFTGGIVVQIRRLRFDTWTTL